MTVSVASGATTAEADPPQHSWHVLGRSWPHGPRELASTLAWLRMCAIGGQVLTVVVVAGWLKIAIPLVELSLGIGVLAAFGCFAFWRLRRRTRVTTADAVAHIAVDTLALGYLLYLTGGATNPFVSLLVMPITLAAAALPLLPVAIVAALAVATYLLLMHFHVPLPSMHGFGTAAGDQLHIIGMAISFAITATMLGFFIARLARALRAHQADAELERVRALRDEGILAIATQAASTAHELNTPLSTIQTLLAELGRERADDAPLRADIALLAGQAERCRVILRELVTVGRSQLAGSVDTTTVGAFTSSACDSFRLLRPEIEVEYTIDAELQERAIGVVPALQHALVNLLNNAADASLANGSTRIELAVQRSGERLDLCIRDFGKGMPANAQQQPGWRFETTKRDGLGLGLALANATAERFGGNLLVLPAAAGGTEQHLRLPLANLENPHHDQ